MSESHVKQQAAMQKARESIPQAVLVNIDAMKRAGVSLDDGLDTLAHAIVNVVGQVSVIAPEFKDRVERGLKGIVIFKKGA